MDQNEINQFFTRPVSKHNIRHEFMSKFQHSGYGLIEKIPKDAEILDVGCGQNLFKPYFPNLIGIDPVFNDGDYKTALLDFKTDKKFNVILCLGSIFGNLNDIKQQIQKMKDMLLPGGKIYWRNHTGLYEDNLPDFFYKWTFETHRTLTKEFNFDLKDLRWDYTDKEIVRLYKIYAEWQLSE